MTPGTIAALIVATVFGVLVAIISYFVKGRFDRQDDEIAGLRRDVDINTIALAALTASQKAVVENQRQLSGVHSKLIDDTEDLEDQTQQLHDATNYLRQRSEAHDVFLANLRGSD